MTRRARNLHALTGAYVVDAVDPDERRIFEDHMAECADCAAEVTSLRDAAGSIIAPDIEPAPATMRDTVLAAARRVEQVAAPTSAGAVTDIASRQRRNWTSRPWLTVAAASALVIAGVGIGAVAVSFNETPQTLEQQVAAIIAAPDASMAQMPWGDSHVVMSPETSQVALMCHEIYRAAPGMVYQLWLKHEDGTMVASITFTPDENGDVMQVVDADLDGVVALAITREPFGGSDVPTGEPLAVAPMA